MSDFSRRDALRLAGLGATASLAGCTSSLGLGGGGDCTTEDGAWRSTELTDVLTDETFTIDAFEKPVLVETFAVWCSNCKRQQDELIAFHEAVGDDVVSVALDTDPNEDAEAVRRHAREHGYDWRYAVSPSDVTDSLVSQFGVSMTNPPQVPMLLRCADGCTRRLKDGHKSASFLREQVDGC
ncbi:TlpA family protein disulfide reductase [Haloarchaeobius iranensis]|uniref:Thiol-disulfide isomerase or thioredoxin n=1 Tax=Haloarchaeobius iranensis TaxID=996166 RepID=A0A1G9WM65_9EURY|nr:TlpA disulfide reductase family protein [Haloarchaeobius iranensis]SDM85135.1 Thiol-disulfide isomerase or thioredoxin [Haloarchaeobius iranensis]